MDEMHGFCPNCVAETPGGRFIATPIACQTCQRCRKCCWCAMDPCPMKPIDARPFVVVIVAMVLAGATLFVRWLVGGAWW